jgi:hypothetical protein
MAGMSLRGNVGGFAGVTPSGPASYGAASSYGAGVSSGAFGTEVTGTGSGKTMSPKTDTGLFFWIGVASIAGLVWLRSTLPN